MTTQTATATAVRTLEIDRSHSEVAFQVRHLLSKVRGRFNEFAGTIEFDESNPRELARRRHDSGRQHRHRRSPIATSTCAAPISSMSRNTRRSRSSSTSVTPRGGNIYDVAGDLTIHGVTRQVVLPASFLGAAQDPWGNTKFVFEAELTLNRKDFGLHVERRARNRRVSRR